MSSCLNVRTNTDGQITERGKPVCEIRCKQTTETSGDIFGQIRTKKCFLLLHQQNPSASKGNPPPPPINLYLLYLWL